MSLLIGGSGSTGSSLLRQRLNKHTQIFISNEWQLYCKPLLYEDWNKNKSKLFKRWIFGLRSSGIKQFTGLDQEAKEAQISIKKLLDKHTFTAFSKALYQQTYKLKEQDVWGDKTPANSYHFLDFLATFPKAKCLLTLRNPLDAIASMHRRGISIYLSTSIYLLNTAHGLASEQNPNIKHVKYEDLLDSPKEVLSHICTFLKLRFEPQMLAASTKTNQDEVTKLDSWQYDETQTVQKQAIRSFDKMTDEQKHKILSAVFSIHIKESWVKKHKLRHSNIAEIAASLHYDLPAISSINSKGLVKEMNYNKWQHTYKCYPLHHFNYPISING